MSKPEGMDDDRVLSVNEAISRLAELNGTVVRVKGVLSLEFEGTCISHLPKAERHPSDGGTDYASSIWVNLDWQFDTDRAVAFGKGVDALNGRHVVVEGTLSAPDTEQVGGGHMGLWPAEITVTSIEKLNKA